MASGANSKSDAIFLPPLGGEVGALLYFALLPRYAQCAGWGDCIANGMANEVARKLRKRMTRQELRLWRLAVPPPRHRKSDA